MKRILLFLVISITVPLNLLTQDNDVINPERPGVTNPPGVMQPKTLEIESGFYYESDRIKDTELKTDNYLYPTTFLRYGLIKNVELRLQFDIAGISTSSAGTRLSSLGGPKPLIVGTKVYMWKQKRSLPETAIVFQLTLPYFGKDEFRPQFPAPLIAFYFQNTFSKKTILGYNLGMQWSGNDPNPVSFAAISPSYNFTKKLIGFVELYSFFQKNTVPDFRFDAGFAYIALNNLQLDVYGGPGITGPTDNYFISAGVSIRLPK